MDLIFVPNTPNNCSRQFGENLNNLDILDKIGDSDPPLLLNHTYVAPMFKCNSKYGGTLILGHYLELGEVMTKSIILTTLRTPTYRGLPKPLKILKTDIRFVIGPCPLIPSKGDKV